MLGWIILLFSFSIIHIGCAGGGGYNETSANNQGTSYLPPPSINSRYQPDVYMDKTQGYQMPTYKYQQQQDQNENRWRYISPQPEQEPQPTVYINTKSGDSYLRLGNDENSWYVGPKGDPIMPFGDWKIDQKGNTYMPFGNGYIDSNGTYLMPTY